jgi:phosphoglucomutase
MAAITDPDQILERARQYLAAEEDADFRAEVERLIESGDEAELLDRFYTDLEFGTGGLRGVIGGGYNRMNPLVVQSATEGLARYVERHGVATDGELRAVIAHDSRRYSTAFALQAALVFAAHGIKAFLFSSLRPTPELSFSVRELKASVGIVVTASHNPPQYNGYKVYWADGAQIVAPHDEGIISEVRQVSGTPNRISKEDALGKGLLEYVDKELDEAFVAMVKRQAIRPELLRERGKDLKVVYTPLHGTGAMMVERVLGDLGITVVSVPEQREPDGEFPTVEFPNPEEASALKMALDLGAREKADLVMGNDPDADRLGIAVPDGDGFTLVTGNQHGVLLADYILSGLRDTGRMPAHPVFVKTIVTTELQRKVAEHYGAEVYDVLTGFKHIATVIRKLEQNPGTGTYVTGGEESYGFLIGTEVRDKDAISATMLTAEMALYHLSQGKSVMDRLRELHEQFGYYEEIQVSRYFQGSAGRSVMDSLMSRLRANPPGELAGVPVERIRDYKDGTTREIGSGEVRNDIDLPSSNVLQFILSDESVVSARPSGTEPKIKFYASVHGEPGTPLTDARKTVANQLDAIRSWVDGQIERATAGA